MKKYLYIIICAGLLFVPLRAGAIIPVTDYANITQSIVNSVQQLLQTSTTASNMINNFKETIKIYQQGKEYYDRLKGVTNLVKDARKVQKTILLIGEVSEIYVNNFQRMLQDKNYSVAELNAIAHGYTKLLQESTDVLTELKNVVNVSALSMTDKERMDVIERAYLSALEYRNLVSYYTRKNIGVSYLRAKKAGDAQKVLALYGTNDRYW